MQSPELTQQPSTQVSLVHGLPSSQLSPSAQHNTSGGHSGLLAQQVGALVSSHEFTVQFSPSLQSSGGTVVTSPLTPRQVAPSQALGCVQTPNAQQSMLQGSSSAQFGTTVLDAASATRSVVGQLAQSLSQLSV
jgi:hypothetical protein